MGVTDLVAPLQTPAKTRHFLTFPIFEDIRYHYYLIYTSFKRKHGGEFNEILFPFFSLRLQRFWRYGGTTSYTETCILRRLLLSFNSQKNCQWYINILTTERAHKKWGSPTSLSHNPWKGRNKNVITYPLSALHRDIFNNISQGYWNSHAILQKKTYYISISFVS